jgi:hypothetical protein
MEPDRAGWALASMIATPLNPKREIEWDDDHGSRARIIEQAVIDKSAAEKFLGQHYARAMGLLASQQLDITIEG